MKPRKDVYELSDQSKTGRYGFDTFQSPGTKLFYFTFNDYHGKPTLFSQSYKSEASRNKGIESVLKNAALSDRYEIFKEGEEQVAYFLVIKAGNRQEIARSRIEHTFKGINKLKDMLMTIGGTAPLNPYVEEPEKNEASVPAAGHSLAESKPAHAVKEAASVSRPIASTRHLFQILVYTDNGHCKLSHVLSGGTQSLKGISGEEIKAFILSYLPENFNAHAEIEVQTELSEQPEESKEAQLPELKETEPVLKESEPNESVALDLISINKEPEIIEETIVNKTELTLEPKQELVQKEKASFDFNAFLHASETPLPRFENTAPIEKKAVQELLSSPTKSEKPPVQQREIDQFINDGKGVVKKGEDDIIAVFLTSEKEVGQFATTIAKEEPLKIAAVAKESEIQAVEVQEDAVLEFILHGTFPEDKKESQANLTSI